VCDTLAETDIAPDVALVRRWARERLMSAEPVLRQAVPTQQGGHGMMFIDHLSSRWGTVALDVEVGKPAKTVWFELAHPATPALPPS
jgi:hypothetical protein